MGSALQAGRPASAWCYALDRDARAWSQYVWGWPDLNLQRSPSVGPPEISGDSAPSAKPRFLHARPELTDTEASEARIRNRAQLGLGNPKSTPCRLNRRSSPSSYFLVNTGPKRSPHRIRIACLVLPHGLILAVRRNCTSFGCNRFLRRCATTSTGRNE